KLPAPGARDASYVVERVGLLRVLFNTGRSDLMAEMRKVKSDPDEMEWTRLRQFAAQSEGDAKREATMLLHKRLGLSLAPLLFSFLGAALALRVRRGGRGLGVLLSLVVLLIYYLVTLAGDQMARAGSLTPALGGWMASVLTLVIAVALLALR